MKRVRTFYLVTYSLDPEESYGLKGRVKATSAFDLLDKVLTRLSKMRRAEWRLRYPYFDLRSSYGFERQQWDGDEEPVDEIVFGMWEQVNRLLDDKRSRNYGA